MESAEYHRLSKRLSPQLLLSHQMTSGQELIPSITPSSRNLFQLPIITHMQEEFPSFVFLLQQQSSTVVQENSIRQISSPDPKTEILQTEINYLQRQHAEAIAIGDFTQQLAAERAIATKLQAIELRQDEQKPSQIQISDRPKFENQSETSVIPTVISEKSLVDRQIRGLLKKHVKHLQEHARKEPRKKQIIHSVEDLRRLSTSFFETKIFFDTFISFQFR